MRASLATRMTILVALVLAAALGVSMLFTVRGIRRSLTAEARRGAVWAANGFEGAIRDGDLPHRWSERQRSATRIASLPRIDRVRLFDASGRIRLSSDGIGEGDEVPPTDVACAGCHAHEPVRDRLAEDDRTEILSDLRILRAYSEVRNEDRCSAAACHDPDRRILGLVEVSAPLRPVDNLVADAVDSSLLISALATVLAALVGGLALSRWLHKPVGRLVQGTRRVAEGDLDHLIPCERQDELGLLCDAFNHMTARLKETKLLLLRSEKLSSLGKLAAGVAHEINNPLTGILSFAEDLRDEFPEDDPRREDCDVILRETLRCRKIVRGLLDFARPAAPGRERVALNKVTRQALALVAKQVEIRNVRVEMLLEPELPAVSADPGQIQQVVLNLLVNARDAVGSRGTITVRSFSHSHGDRVELVVDDTGPGVPVELRETIFEPFYSTKADRGSGIGLDVARTIAEAHGGHLLVTDAPAGGARFRLVLSTQRADEALP